MTEGWVEIKVALIALLLAMLWWLEGAAPLFLERRDRSRRLARHLFLAVFNGILVVPFLSVAAWLTSTLWFREHGLLAWLSLPLLIETFLAVVLIDLWMYAWHRANHSMPLLWRFHRVHHSDPELDSTSAFRFHTGEIVLSAVFRLALIPLLSIQLWHLLLYELVMLPVILLHHSNINMPARLDRALRAVIVTPWMHWVHHSSYQPETDSNFLNDFFLLGPPFRDVSAGGGTPNDSIRPGRVSGREVAGTEGSSPHPLCFASATGKKRPAGGPYQRHRPGRYTPGSGERCEREVTLVALLILERTGHRKPERRKRPWRTRNHEHRVDRRVTHLSRL
jgi:sterol desaturase/sphingolipid hydroxylase (fatty acid hydroxylase superfamily)